VRQHTANAHKYAPVRHLNKPITDSNVLCWPTPVKRIQPLSFMILSHQDEINHLVSSVSVVWKISN